MTTPTSNIKLSDIQTEFGGSNPISLSEYYKGGSFVPAAQVTSTIDGTPISTSGQIRLGEFRAVTKTVAVTMTVSISSTSVDGLSSASKANVGVSVKTDAITITVSGGTAPYTYAYSLVSGNSATVNSPTAASTTFTRTVLVPTATVGTNTTSGVYHCTVTDATGNSVVSAAWNVNTTAENTT